MCFTFKITIFFAYLLVLVYLFIFKILRSDLWEFYYFKFYKLVKNLIFIVICIVIYQTTTNIEHAVFKKYFKYYKSV